MTSAIYNDKKITKDLVGIAGEYFVAAELSRKGFIAAVTLRNTRGADILVSRSGGGKAATVQVKTSKGGRKAWTVQKCDEIPKKDHYYVFVMLNGHDGQPEYYIAPSSHVAEWTRTKHAEWLKGKKRDGSKRNPESRRLFFPDEKHRDAWDLIAV